MTAHKGHRQTIVGQKAVFPAYPRGVRHHLGIGSQERKAQLGHFGSGIAEQSQFADTLGMMSQEIHDCGPCQRKSLRRLGGHHLVDGLCDGMG